MTSLVLAVILTYVSGVRGYWVLVLPVVLFFLCASIISIVARRLFPPELETVSDE